LHLRAYKNMKISKENWTRQIIILILTNFCVVWILFHFFIDKSVGEYLEKMLLKEMIMIGVFLGKSPLQYLEKKLSCESFYLLIKPNEEKNKNEWRFLVWKMQCFYSLWWYPMIILWLHDFLLHFFNF